MARPRRPSWSGSPPGGAPAGSTPSPATSRSFRSPGVPTLHLLVIEDDERLGRVLKRLLEEDRHVVDLARDGESGLDLAAADGIDVVVLDVGLPDISGIEVAKRLRRRGTETATLMLTARDTVADRVTGLDAGADDYLVKPFAF